ncbi:MAG: hypothetical protein JRG92_06495 [Deltaproteobacteria bacterium]|nr:hypothetical protein [Deltaproteobacteria bacterium]MBW2383263.1 hypothetical protein [Deltaproteobacteria bacterium]MBW2694997.1 hypothetical protein [Deltaproteobacteria bacterium]
MRRHDRIQAIATDGRYVLSGLRDGDHLELVDVEAERTRHVPLCERILGSETLALHFTSGLFVALTENGVVAVEPCGRERWRISEITFGWRLLASDADALWLADVHDNVFAIDPESGEEASV